jgi:6-phosphogluconate dehydrogenase
MTQAIGVVGLGVMGKNLALNIESRGFSVAGYDLDPAKAQALVAGEAKGRSVVAVDSPEQLMAALERPRRILTMVPAGKPVDDVIAHLRPHMQAGDILIDGGNSFFQDTERRCRELEVAGLEFVGMGVSGGEEGALHGPSLMPGGSREAWLALAPILRAIAATAEDGEPCAAHIGPRGAGHYVKMVHNGIEYGDMQLIAEVYDLLHRGAGLPAAELATLFEEWNRGELRSYLVEITAKILGVVDPETKQPLVDLILDEAKQKGTGKWASQNAFDIGAPIPTIDSAVSSRIVSALKQERVAASRVLHGPAPSFTGDRARLVDAARQALHASKITSYAQGLALLRIASLEYGYGIQPGEVARIWRAGCIIRARLLGDIRDAYRRNPELVNLLLDDAFRTAVEERQQAWRFVVQTAVGLGIPAPALSASLAYFDAYRSERLPANLVQGQRDYFGAHTYRRTDREGSFHTEWPGAK